MTSEKVRPMALVLGALSGVGRDISRELARRHFDLLLMDADGSGLFHARQELQASYPVHVQLFQGQVAKHGHRMELVQVLRTVGVKLDVVAFLPHWEASHSRQGLGGEARLDVEKGHLALDDLLLEGVLPAMVQEGNGYVLCVLKGSLLEKHCPLSAQAAAAAALESYCMSMNQAWGHARMTFTVGVIGTTLESWFDKGEGAHPGEQGAAKKLLTALFSRKRVVKVPGWGS